VLLNDYGAISPDGATETAGEIYRRFLREEVRVDGRGAECDDLRTVSRG